jgi:hypothetical protein
MTRYRLDFVDQGEQRTFFNTLYQGLDGSCQGRMQASVMAQIGDFVSAYGPGRGPIIRYVGRSTWLVALISTNQTSPEQRLVERVYVFSNPSSPDIARTVTATLHDLVEDMKYIDGMERVQQRRKLHHLCAVIDPHLESMFGCVADRKAQEIILRRIEERSDMAATDVTVSAGSTLLGLSRLLGIFRSRRNAKSVNDQ